MLSIIAWVLLIAGINCALGGGTYKYLSTPGAKAYWWLEAGALMSRGLLFFVLVHGFYKHTHRVDWTAAVILLAAILQLAGQIVICGRIEASRS